MASKEQLPEYGVPVQSNSGSRSHHRVTATKVVGCALIIIFLFSHQLADRALHVFRPVCEEASSFNASQSPWDFTATLTTEERNKLEPGTIFWGPCVPAVRNLECGSIVIPKDHFDSAAGNAIIAFGKWKATKSPKKGSIFLNPGGPGGAGTRLVGTEERGKAMAKLLGDDYDLIGFDPRGIGSTVPATRCFPSPAINTVFFANTVIEQGITVPSTTNLSSPRIYHGLVEQYRQFISLKQAQAELCRKNMGDELKYMGTATVVRDIDFMTKIMDGKDAKINYWGGSYGSILGAYLVNMLPHRIGYSTIDGIADPVSWSSEPSHKWPHNWLAHSEKTYQLFLKGCSEAGPNICPLTKYKGEPWKDIEARFEDFFDSLALAPLPVADGFRPGFLTSGTARALLQIFLQRPTSWPLAAQYYASAFAGNGTAIFDLLSKNFSANHDLSRLAVTCLDSPSNKSHPPTAKDLADQALKNLMDVSLHFGVSTGISEPDGGCEYWPVKGPERFVGPWNASLEIPLLIVSNTADPITPMSSGLLVNAMMPNSSTLLIQDGPGHCSSALPSLCTAKTVRGYFAGQVPKNGTWCDVDVSPFPSEDEPDAFKSMDVEDRELIEAMVTLGDIITEARSGHAFLDI